MARKLTLAAVVRLITSAVKPTAAKLPKGGLAHGSVPCNSISKKTRRTLYGSDGTEVYELTPAAHTVLLTELDTAPTSADTVNGNPVYYSVVSNSPSPNTIVGVMAVFSDNMRHVVTQVLTTHYSFKDNGVLDFTAHTDAKIYQYFRSYGLNAASIPNGAWTAWQRLLPDEALSGGKLQTGLLTAAMTRLMPVAIVVVRFTSAKTCELNQVRDVLGSSLSAYSFDNATYPYIRINVPSALSALGLSWAAEASEIRFSGTLDRTFPAPMADWDGTHLQGLFVQGPSDVDLTGYGIVFKVYAS